MNAVQRHAARRYLQSVLCLYASAVMGQDPFEPLGAETRPLATRWQTDYSGALQLGLGHTSDDNFMFGQYNGLHEQGPTVIGNLQWNDFRSGDSYWQVSLSDLGLDTREGELVWGIAERLKLKLGFDSQLQVRNDTGRTPFRGSDELTLPDDWVSGLYTGDFTGLDSALQTFDRQLDRERYSFGLEATLTEHWQLSSNFSYEDKEGVGDVGAAIYIDAASGDAALLAAPVDYSTTEFDLGLSFAGKSLYLDGKIAYSDFDNQQSLLSWQNPYSSFGPSVAYPAGQGGLGLAPDNTLLSGRLSGHLILNTVTRLQFDGSYSLAEQDQRFADYSVNPLLSVTEPLPRSNLNGEVATSTFSAKLLMRPVPKFNLIAKVKIRDKDYDSPRDGYQYVLGDGGDQARSALTVYNTAHDSLSQMVGFEAGYRLPMRSKISLDYEFEEVERTNAAVKETQESRLTIGYRIQILPNLRAKLALLVGNRSADTYQWDQSYYALLDTQLINDTPDNQRYINHPQLSQYYLSNREQAEAKLDVNYAPTSRWNLAANLTWRDEDFDKSELGLTGTQWRRLHLNASYFASNSVTASVYAGFDQYESEQASRAFRGGQEKNAFDIYPPLPQASDPGRNWEANNTDSSVSLGANLSWQLQKDIDLELDYSYVDTNAEQEFKTYGAADLMPQDLPDNETSMHHMSAGAHWNMQQNLTLSLDYQYYRYSADDWAWQNVNPDTIGKVLTFGERNPNEQLHYIGASVIYRWQ